MKIAATFFGETGKSTEEYYYRDGKLIFVFRKESRYHQPLSGKVINTKENRFYFSNDKLIKMDPRERPARRYGFNQVAERQSEYLKSSKQFTEGIRSAKPTIADTP